jgi:hypothetical protein
LNPALVLIGSGCLVCLLPLALCFLFLSFLNNRRQPTLLSGAWDLAFLLLGLSGFFVVGGPIMLSAFDSLLRGYLFEGNFGQIRAMLRSDAVAWSILCASYVATLAVGINVLLRWRRRVSVIYNLSAADPEILVTQALGRLTTPWRKLNGIFEIQPEAPAATLGTATGSANGNSNSFVGASTLQVDAFPTMRHVTLTWYNAEPLVRRAVEGELTKELDSVTSPPNPAGSWFLTGAVALLFVMLLWMGVLIFWMIRAPVPT